MPHGNVSGHSNRTRNALPLQGMLRFGRVGCHMEPLARRSLPISYAIQPFSGTKIYTMLAVSNQSLRTARRATPTCHVDREALLPTHIVLDLPRQLFHLSAFRITSRREYFLRTCPRTASTRSPAPAIFASRVSLPQIVFLPQYRQVLLQFRVLFSLLGLRLPGTGLALIAGPSPGMRWARAETTKNDKRRIAIPNQRKASMASTSTGIERQPDYRMRLNCRTIYNPQW